MKIHFLRTLNISEIYKKPYEKLLLILARSIFIFRSVILEEYSKSSQTSKIERFAKRVKLAKSL